MNYYFLASLLPELQIGSPPELDFLEFKALVNANVSKRDLLQIRTLCRYYDILNLRSYWRKEPLSGKGNYNENELEEVLLTYRGLPDYVFDYLDKFESPALCLRNFAFLLSEYFNHEIPKAEGFLKEYLEFEKGMRLVLIGFRAKRLKRDLLHELQYEDPNDDLVAQLLAQRDAKEYEPPFLYSELKPLFEDHAEQPLELYKIMNEYRFQKVDEMLGTDFFSIDRLLAYMIQLVIVEKWLELDKKQGMEIVDTIVKEAS